MTKKDLCIDHLVTTSQNGIVGATKLDLGESQTLDPGITEAKGAPLVTWSFGKMLDDTWSYNIWYPQ